MRRTFWELVKTGCSILKELQLSDCKDTITIIQPSKHKKHEHVLSAPCLGTNPVTLVWIEGFGCVPCYLKIAAFTSFLICCDVCGHQICQAHSQAVWRWSLTKIDEGHSGAEGKGRGGLSVNLPTSRKLTPSFFHPSIHPSIHPADKQWLGTEAFSDQHGQMYNAYSKRNG